MRLQDCMGRFRVHFPLLPNYLGRLKELRSKTLVCQCVGHRQCHADVWVEAFSQLARPQCWHSTARSLRPSLRVRRDGARLAAPFEQLFVNGPMLETMVKRISMEVEAIRNEQARCLAPGAKKRWS